MSDVYELGIGISFPEGEFTEQQVDAITDAFVNFQKVAEATGASVTPAMTGLNESLSDLSSSMSDTLTATVGSELGAAFMASFAQAVTEGGEEVAAAADGAGQAVAEFAQQARDETCEAADKTENCLKSISDNLKAAGQEIQKGQQWLEGFGDTGTFGGLVELEDASHKMAVGLGMAGERAQYMRTEMLQLVSTTQFSIGEVTRLAQGLHQTGRGLDEFGVSAQQNMIALNDIFGVSGEQIAQTDRTLESFGGSLTDQLDVATAFQDKYQVPGMFAALPGVVDHAQRSVVEFGSAVIGSGNAVIGNVTKTAGAFAKGFGKTIAESVQEAQASFDRFARVTKTNRRVFLGLESDFDPLQKAFMEVGVPLWESSKLIQDATSDSDTALLDFVMRTKKHIDGLDSFRADRFMEQLRDELPAATMELIENDQRLEQFSNGVAEAQERQQRMNEAGIRTFEELSDEMLNTTKELRKMWFNVKELTVTTLVQTGVMDALKGAFRGAKDVVGAFAGSIETFVRSEGFQEWAERVKPLVSAVGKGVLLLGGAFSAVTTTIGGVMAGKFGLLKLGSLLKNIGGRSGLLSALGTRLKEVFGKIGARVMASFGGKLLKGIPVIGTVISAVDGVVTAFRDMGDVMGDPSATGMEKFEALLRGTIKGVGTFLNNILLGIPGFIAGVFFPDMERQFDRGFAGLFDSVREFDLGEAVVGMWNTATGWLGDQVRNLDQFLLERFPDPVGMMQSWGRSLGGAIGGLVTFLAETTVWWIKGTFGGGFLRSALTSIWEAAFSEGGEEGIKAAEPGVLSAVGSILGSLGMMVKGAVMGIADGIAGAFGTSLEELKIHGQMTFASLAEKGFDMAASVVGGLIRIGSLARTAFDIMTSSAEHGWTMLKLGGLKAVGGIIDTFMGEGGFVSTIMSGFEKLAVAFGMEDIAISINEARKGLEGFGKETTDKITNLENQIADQAGLTEMWAAAQEQANKAAERGTSDLIGYRDAMADTRTELQGQLETAQATRENLQMWNRHVREQNDGLDDVLATMAKQGKMQDEQSAFAQLNTQASAQAARNFSDYMDTTISQLSAGLQKGTITAEDAMQKLAEAKVQGVKDAIAGAKAAQDKATGKAGDVAKKATGDDGTGGFGATQQQLKALMIALNKGALARGQDVTVTLKGAGAIEKEMARKSAVERYKQGAN